MFFAISLVIVVALFALILFFPYKSIGNMIEESFDDYSMDLDLKANSQEDMISAALPEENKVEEKESNQLNLVDETQELAPETIEPETEKKEEEKAQE